MTQDMQIIDGWLSHVTRVDSPFYDERPAQEIPSLLVIHNISLPPEQFGGPYIDQLFTGKLNPAEHPYFEIIHQFQVSAHCLIRRDGEIVQYVNFNQRAWHAGISQFEGRERCNDFSIGIELEGSDNQPFNAEQYQQLQLLTILLMKAYPITPSRITGHSDIAPGRKTDPGPYFDWHAYRSSLSST